MNRRVLIGCLSIPLLALVGYLILGASPFGEGLPSLQAQTVPVVVQHAVIDDSRLVKRIVDLKDGESAFATADSMVVDESKKCWLNPYAITGEEDTKFKVTKKADGYHVEVTDKGLRWSRVSLEIAVSDAALRSKFAPIRTLKADPLK